VTLQKSRKTHRWIRSQKRGFLRRYAETEQAGEKTLKPLSELILDFGLAKGKSAVEFREGS
jgi:hypothetical protein